MVVDSPIPDELLTKRGVVTFSLKCVRKIKGYIDMAYENPEEVPAWNPYLEEEDTPDAAS